MSFLEAALDLADLGFYVFPIVPDGKTPLFEGWQEAASRDPKKIKAMWTCPVMEFEQPYNIGIFCGKFKGDLKLIAVDVDNHEGQVSGDDGILQLELEGYDLPETYQQETPSNGRHFLYTTTRTVGNSDSGFPPGINIRGVGGYVVGAGSEIKGKKYLGNIVLPVAAPDWLLDRCKESDKKRFIAEASGEINDLYALHRAERYLKEQPGAVQGSRGSTAYKLANQLKDFGLDAKTCSEAMAFYWAERCEPPMAVEDLEASVEHAYLYGKNQIGVSAPETVFEELPIPEEEPEEKKLDPMSEMNKEYAFILSGGSHHILWETTDEKGSPTLAHLNEQSFHRKFAGQYFNVGDGKTETISSAWMKSRQRRSYKGFCFRPGLPTPEGFYNLFRGFSVEPLDREPTPREQRSVDLFMEHLEQNICKGDESLALWLKGYFAHMFQKPYELPGVSIVLRGVKGVGKNKLVDTLGKLLGTHYLVASNRRYLVGNFNGHLEKLIMFTLDEAFWSGDKAAEGTLKDLITGSYHVIERKGKESYRVENCIRLVILGNEEWLVPASEDERRYAVFDVGAGRKQDRAFFGEMMEGLEAGGYRLLLKYFLDFDLSQVEVGKAPMTKGLLDQKLKSMGPLTQWWFDCLFEGEVRTATSDEGVWPDHLPKDDVRDSFRQYIRERNMKVRVPDARNFLKELKACAPSALEPTKVRDGMSTKNEYKFMDLKIARREFEHFIGHGIIWHE